MLYHLFIINKSGGLIYNKNLSSSATQIDINDWLVLGSTFHSLYSITAQIGPVKSEGIQELCTETFRLNCFHTKTGTKFFITVRLDTPNVETLLRQIYVLYSDYVLKNPFYELEMPIRCDLFNMHLEKLILKTEKEMIALVGPGSSHNSGGGGHSHNTDKMGSSGISSSRSK